MLNNILKVLGILVLLQWLAINSDEMIYAYYNAQYELAYQSNYTDVYDNREKREQLDIIKEGN
tara:strand:+ start:314 stop:502 length:189 start_codon:yes stop_codon:yes gene_type:complete